jgi:hypothetical protein
VNSLWLVGSFGGPAAAHARQLKGFALDAEGLSRRDSPKVEAQYPLRRTEKWCKKTRPSREVFGFESRLRLSDCEHSSIVPCGTDHSLKTLTQSAAADTGLS